MSSSNPFAEDDALLKDQERSQSTASPLNPYAAPPSSGEYHASRELGVGIWRERDMLVIHAEADFPPRCLLTNELADEWRSQEVKWWYAIDWMSRRKTFVYAISAEGYAVEARQRRRKFMWGLIMLALAIALVTGTALVGRFGGNIATLAYILVSIGVILLISGYRYQNTLQFRQIRKDYFWLHGAKRAFLDSLPAWPGVD
ncbi:hypothetical protein ETAA8_34210 [Anatilimnocola aggregata]|uniref:Uncharacterized protein n=1 Tax=Anatilimnocola aggregata TaxID=2528021 RepID=A0A517YDK9_9BACT|nr:hypothetical protein [Anatilimnocola aggregata]QDU28321.1 hypothetical protein ETAA8_34210 [Anatilimnocola aggregata]